MSQQINLYQPIFRRQRKIFSAVTIMQAAGLFVVGLLAIYGFARWQVASLESQVESLEAQRDAAMTQLQTLTGTPQVARSRLLDRQLTSLEQETAQKQRLLAALETRRFGNDAGFSAHLSALARQRVNGLWLTRITLSESAVELAGRTEAGELVPRYLSRLGQETAFAGTDFARIELSRDDERAASVAFTVSTTPGGVE